MDSLLLMDSILQDEDGQNSKIKWKFALRWSGSRVGVCKEERSITGGTSSSNKQGSKRRKALLCTCQALL